MDLSQDPNMAELLNLLNELPSTEWNDRNNQLVDSPAAELANPVDTIRPYEWPHQREFVVPTYDAKQRDALYLPAKTSVVSSDSGENTSSVVKSGTVWVEDDSSIDLRRVHIGTFRAATTASGMDLELQPVDTAITTPSVKE
ncbi:unnamed protein product [Gongylonema pulchrum]|uniref:Head-to-tail adaptor n=1 Tax=Gongylonema pulchrum TaxID=637853 RepID=A0A183EBX0_9BILA|nr:unnamed protein product [Gongylonema pulchrum]